jgi:hypothetical protein
MHSSRPARLRTPAPAPAAACTSRAPAAPPARPLEPARGAAQADRWGLRARAEVWEPARVRPPPPRPTQLTGRAGSGSAAHADATARQARRRGPRRTPQLQLCRQHHRSGAGRSRRGAVVLRRWAATIMPRCAGQIRGEMVPAGQPHPHALAAGAGTHCHEGGGVPACIHQPAGRVAPRGGTEPSCHPGGRSGRAQQRNRRPPATAGQLSPSPRVKDHPQRTQPPGPTSSCRSICSNVAQEAGGRGLQ